MTASVAVDVVVLTVAPQQDGRPRLVFRCLRRVREPFTGRWSLPGRVVADDEDLDDAAGRVFSRCTGLPGPRHIEQLATFGDPRRDPRGRIVSVSYLALLADPASTRASVQDPAADDVGWCAATTSEADARHLAFDHAVILAAGVERLRSKLGYSNVAYGLLPDEFTLRELQDVYEAALSTTLDKRNFRKKVLGLELVAETPNVRRGSHRPAQLYRFAHHRLVTIEAAAIA